MGMLSRSACSHATSRRTGATREEVDAVARGYWEAGVSHIVALRGDPPPGATFAPHPGGYAYASDLVTGLRRVADVEISVAAYPETHPQARSPEADLKAFAAKVAAGANSAITQMFFNADAYFRFVDEVRALGLAIPIVPGIMPITNSSGLMRFADNSGCEIPRWMRLRLQSFGDDTASIKAFGQEVMARLCERLVAGGAPSLHFYTMNQAGPTLALAKAIAGGVIRRGVHGSPAPSSCDRVHDDGRLARATGPRQPSNHRRSCSPSAATRTFSPTAGDVDSRTVWSEPSSMRTLTS